MRVLLDTHVWLWLASEPARLSRVARETVAGADGVAVATISCWEVATLARKGRIKLDRDVARWIRQALSRAGLEAVPLSPSAATAAALLGEGFPGDPADRMIYSTARELGAPLLTKDAALRGFDPRGTLW